jgi:hypothetical protein
MRILRRFLARVKNFAMGQRSREFGIRIAVGATRGNVMAVVFHHGLRWVTDGRWMTDEQCVGEMVIYAHEPQHAAQIHRSVTTYSVQNSISDTLRSWHFCDLENSGQTRVCRTVMNPKTETRR